MSYIDSIQVFSDGGCRGNPGPGAIGVFVTDVNNSPLFEYSECIGNTTNNRAEYKAAIKGLDIAAKFTRGRALIFCDSELVVNHMNGTWRLKDDELRKLFYEVKQVSQAFKEVIFQHVKRTNQNIKKADRILNNAFEGRPISRLFNKKGQATLPDSARLEKSHWDRAQLIS